MTDPTWLSNAAGYWADEMGCPAEELFAEPLLLKAHGQRLDDYNGIFALFRRGRAVISFPSDRLEDLSATLPTNPLSPDLLASHFMRGGYRVIGPAFIGYAAEVPQTAGGVRALEPPDMSLVETLQAACDETEWEYGGSEPARVPCTGAFEDGSLAALAGYEIWNHAIAHISVITHPSFRGKGYGRQAVMELAGMALAAGLVPQYRTLESNIPSMRIAGTLGFERYATSVAVRLE